MSDKVVEEVVKEVVEEVVVEVQKYEVDAQFLRNIRGVIDIASERIHWKSSELLPIGILVKQIDNLLIDK